MSRNRWGDFAVALGSRGARGPGGRFAAVMVHALSLKSVARLT